jgi:hypothetical protein
MKIEEANPLIPAPSLTAAAGSIYESANLLNEHYKAMESLAARVIATVKTNFEHGTITTKDGKGDDTLRSMLEVWEGQFKQYTLDMSGEDSSNSD